MAGHSIFSMMFYNEKENIIRGPKSEEWLKLNKYKMYYVYILQSIKYPSKSYKGSTENLKERLKTHNSGKVDYTSKFKPWKIVYYCAFTDKKKALDFEKYLKTASGIAFIRKRLI